MKRGRKRGREDEDEEMEQEENRVKGEKPTVGEQIKRVSELCLVAGTVNFD